MDNQPNPGRRAAAGMLSLIGSPSSTAGPVDDGEKPKNYNSYYNYSGGG